MLSASATGGSAAEFLKNRHITREAKDDLDRATAALLQHQDQHARLSGHSKRSRTVREPAKTRDAQRSAPPAPGPD